MGSIYVVPGCVRGTSGQGKKIALFHVKNLDSFSENRQIITLPDEVTNDAEIQQLKAQNELLKRENALLKEKIDLLIRRIFGVKSEKLDPGQPITRISRGSHISIRFL